VPGRLTLERRTATVQSGFQAKQVSSSETMGAIVHEPTMIRRAQEFHVMALFRFPLRRASEREASSEEP
jgi:hypothetical protein